MRLIIGHLDRTNLVNKGFIIWLLGKFFLWDTAASPELPDGPILPTWEANHSAGFGSSCPLVELANREIKLDVMWSYVKRQTAKMTSEFVFFSSNR